MYHHCGVDPCPTLLHLFLSLRFVLFTYTYPMGIGPILCWWDVKPYSVIYSSIARSTPSFFSLPLLSPLGLSLSVSNYNKYT